MTYRVGIVGSGFGGSVHAPAYSLHPAFEPVALASPNRADAVAKERNIPRAFDSVEAMLAAMGDEIDVVSVASPPFDHHRSVMAALAAGKHVLCEKPFALNLAQAEEMTAEGDRAGTVCAVAFEFRFNAAQRALKELALNDHVTPLREIEITRFGRDLRAGTLRPRSDWWYDRSRGGGLANAVLPHVIDLSHWLAGREPLHTQGFLRTANPLRRDDAGAFTSDVADGCFALLDYGDGLIGRLTVDHTTVIEQTTLAIHGENRTAVASGPFFVDMSLFIVEAEESDEFQLAVSPYEKFGVVHGNLPPFLSLLDAFADRIANPEGGEFLPSFHDGLAAQRTLAALGFEA